jgi:NADH-ubiquinone oxidoreductase chain 6
MNNFLLGFISMLAILSGVLVITSKNPVIAVIFLISLFINTAIFLILLGIGFLGISYIIIYIGAITVLFLFIIMMLNIRLLDILEIGYEYTKNLPLALLVGSLFIFELFSIIPFSSISQNNISFLNFIIDFLYDIINLFTNNNQFSNLLTIVSLINYSPDYIISNFTQVVILGQGLYTYGALWLILASLILLLSMVSAIFLSTNSTSYGNKN